MGNRAGTDMGDTFGLARKHTLRAVQERRKCYPCPCPVPRGDFKRARQFDRTSPSPPALSPLVPRRERELENSALVAERPPPALVRAPAKVPCRRPAPSWPS